MKQQPSIDRDASVLEAGGGGGVHVDDVSHFVARNGSVLSMRRGSSLGSLHAGHSSWITASGSLLTAIIGAGVLGLPNSVAWMGWVGGPVALLVFFVVSLWAALMLCDVYNVNGRRHTRYKFAVYWLLGPRNSVVLSIAQHTYLVLSSIGYQIAGADSMTYIARRICAAQGTPIGACFHKQTYMTLIFGAAQLLMSQLPDLESTWWATAVAAVMSLGYSLLAIGLGASEAGNGLGSVAGRTAASSAKAFGILSSLGNCAFAFTAATVLLEIQDTLREPPAAAVSMRKTLFSVYSITGVLYLAVSCVGYAALGDAVPGNVLLGFAAAPAWVTLLANFAVLIHMVPAYQVMAQPCFATIEDLALRCAGKRGERFDAAFAGREWVFRLLYRPVFVGVTTLVACALPFFGVFIGLLGALTFYPTVIYFPFRMYTVAYSPGRWKQLVMNAVSAVMAVVAAAATVASVVSIAESAAQFKPFTDDGGTA